MAKFLFKTKSGQDITGKARIFFTSHPDDFGNTFQKICNDILKTHDCVIYYTSDMSEPFDDEQLAQDLSRMNLFVIPISLKLLLENCRTMQIDLPFAKEHKIPILPILFDTGIVNIYSRADKFGSIQYLSPLNSDPTAISYEDKLRKYLDSVIIGDELAKRIRQAFDAYIFLSYRKKDRAFANELMHLIHDDPNCRDIAIWYDEFLVPGESFNDNISNIIHKCDLFTLLVTPNIVEEPNGVPNFIMKAEYPLAKKTKKPILPVEMAKTDRTLLEEKFEDIPACINKLDKSFNDSLVATLSRIAKSASEDSPEHNFLIGLAYLDGIDVEINREKALELITSSAEQNLPEAMLKLYKMYHDGIGVELDYDKACIWASRLAEHSKSTLGEEHEQTLAHLYNLAYCYNDCGKYSQALELNTYLYEKYKSLLGKEHPSTLLALQGMAFSCNQLKLHERALEISEEAYEIRKKVLGEEHPATLGSLQSLAYSYGKLGRHKDALPLNKRAYALRCKVLGKEHPVTLGSLQAVAFSYGRLGDYKTALALNKKAYTLRCKALGKEHPLTIGSLQGFAYIYEKLGKIKKALNICQACYELRSQIIGKDHPLTISSLQALAENHGRLGNFKEEIKLLTEVVSAMEKIFGADNKDTLYAKEQLRLAKLKI